MEIKNPTDVNAVIVFENDDLKKVVPDEITVAPGATVQWEVIPNNQKVSLGFKERSPFIKDPQRGATGNITGTIKGTAEGFYPYSVTDDAGTITIDPRIQVKP